MQNFNRIQLYVVVLFSISMAMSLASFFSYKYYLIEYSQSYVNNFRLQNLNLIESNSTLELTQKFELTKKSGLTNCLLAKTDNNIFYKYGSCECDFVNLFKYCVNLKPSGNNKIEIQFGMELPTKLKLAFFVFLMTNLSLSILSISLLLIYEKTNEKNSLKIIEITKQVSHDIRSPLSALNMITRTLQDIPEDKRLMIRNSIQRINDIANDLLTKGKQNTNADGSMKITANFKSQELILLPALIDTLLSEKRIQYRDQIQVQIHSDFKNSFGDFVIANGKELMRVLSNLINNSIEAFANKSGEVIVSIENNSILRSTDNTKAKSNTPIVLISIKDNGKGIPASILEKLGQQGVSYGKEGTQSGSGIGIYHAKKTIEELGGQFKILSQVGQGTEIQIYLPRAKSPAWFLESLVLSNNTQIISLDDDISIHQIWKGRLSSLNANFHSIQLQSFTSAIEFKKYIEQQNLVTNIEKSSLYNDSNPSYCFLMDYELLGQNTNGLKLIEELGLQKNVTLVTSRYEEPQIQQKCEQLGIKLLPKQLAGFVPIKLQIVDSENSIDKGSNAASNSLKKNVRQSIILSVYDWVLIDDDPLVHMTWEFVAKEKQKRFLGFKSYSEFVEQKDGIAFSSNIFIDSNLGVGTKGEEIAKYIYEYGFINLYLATGYEADQFENLSYIRSVVGKEPPLMI